MFCDHLKRIRKASGKRQEDLANYLNISKQSVSKWERGLSLPSVDLLPRIAELYDCPINAFFSEYELQIFEKLQAERVTEKETMALLVSLLADEEEEVDTCYESSIPTEALFLPKIAELLSSEQSISHSLVQRRLFVGYAVAAQIIDALASLGIIKRNEITGVYDIDVSKIRLLDPYINKEV